jgi:pimeloyl-ACP methyl ester carboxylesterase
MTARTAPSRARSRSVDVERFDVRNALGRQGAEDPRHRQPIVILGGFLSTAGIYRRMAYALERLARRPVTVVQLGSADWMLLVYEPAWPHLLQKIERAVLPAARGSATGKVTLIGHSAGGVLARLYLGDQPFRGRSYAGTEVVNYLITLGSPHYNRGGLTRGGGLSRWVEGRYPGAYFAPAVHYTSVAGKWARCGDSGARGNRWLCKVYREIGGADAEWGDGLIPVASALLRGSRQIILEGVSHFSSFGLPWYGSAEAIPRWWSGAGPG